MKIHPGLFQPIVDHFEVVERATMNVVHCRTDEDDMPVRLYRPRSPILDGSWTFPQAHPAN